MKFYLSTAGSVDSGKTTFFQYYTNKKTSEFKNRTQKLSFLKTKVREEEVFIVDIPGHQAFTYQKCVALELCDLVLYFVDARNPDLSLLSQIKSYDRPVLVLLNKMDYYVSGLKQLKEYSRSEDQAALYRALQNVDMQETTTLKPNLIFDLANMESLFNKDQFYYVPISLKSGWGLKELQLILERIRSKVRRNHSSYVYCLNETANRTYIKFIDRRFSPDEDLYCEETPLKIRHQSESEYVTDPEVRNVLKSKVLVKVSDGPQTHVKLPILEESELFLDQIKTLLKDLKLPPVRYYSQDVLGRKTFQDLFRKLGMQSVEMKTKDFSDKDTYYFVWAKKEKSQGPNVLYNESFYELLDLLKTILKKLIKENKQKITKEVKENFMLGMIHQEYVFASKNNKITIGAELISGVLKSKSQVLFVDKELNVINSAVVEQIQKEKCPLSELRNPGVLCALKLRVKNKLSSRETYFVNQKTVKKRALYVRLLTETNELSGLKKQVLDVLPSYFSNNK